jgi:hypothetical protein
LLMSLRYGTSVMNLLPMDQPRIFEMIRARVVLYGA